MKFPKELIEACVSKCIECIQCCENFEMCAIDKGECEPLAKKCVTECMVCSHACSKLVKELEAYIRENVDNKDMLENKSYLNEIIGVCGECVFMCDSCSASCEKSVAACQISCKKCIETCYACVNSCKKCLYECHI